MAKRFRTWIVLMAWIVGASMPAAAWNRLAGLVIPISEAFEHAKSGDRFVIEGVVIDQKDDRIFRLRDDSGDMYVRITENLRREYGTPKLNELIRVAGRYAMVFRHGIELLYQVIPGAPFPDDLPASGAGWHHFDNPLGP